MISDRSTVAAAEEPMDPIVLAAIEVAMELACNPVLRSFNWLLQTAEPTLDVLGKFVG